MATKTLKYSLLASLLPLCFSQTAISADLGGLFDAVANTVVNEAADAIKNVTANKSSQSKTTDNSSANSQVDLNKRPSFWTNNYIWWQYPTGTPKIPYKSSGLVEDASIAKDIDAYSAVKWSSVPFQNSIVRVRGTGEKSIAVVADPNCPVSRDLERMLNAEDNVTIYFIIAPIWKGKAPQSSIDLSRDINCAPGGNLGRARAWENWMLQGKRPAKQANCSFNRNAHKIVSDLKSTRGSDDGKYLRDLSPVTIAKDGFILGGRPIKEELHLYLL